MKILARLLALLLFCALAACGFLAEAPVIAPTVAACYTCVDGDVQANASSASPLPFFPQLCDKLLGDCSGRCGTALASIVTAIATSADPKTQATEAYAEARVRVGLPFPASPDAGK
jgi:hypothetical protein